MNLRLKTRTAWIAIFAMFFQTLIPLAHASSEPHGFMSELCSMGGEKFVFIQTNATDDHSKTPQPDSMAYRCPLCVAGAHCALTGDAIPAVTPLPALAHVLSDTSTAFAPLSELLLHFSSRAPPLV